MSRATRLLENTPQVDEAAKKFDIGGDHFHGSLIYNNNMVSLQIETNDGQKLIPIGEVEDVGPVVYGMIKDIAKKYKKAFQQLDAMADEIATLQMEIENL